MNESLKVQPRHLERAAYLYVRQSSMRQVIENVESTKRQYALRGRASALGWRDDQIIVIDSDQGESGASASWREGFQRLVTDVGMGHAGIVMGLEVSRLARNNADWHRLLEICALADTLILDEDGVYDPASFNDRLLLGLKGTMSEAELHVLKARLRGGILNKVRRGEYRCPLPTGLAYNEVGNVVLDPDAQIRAHDRVLLRDILAGWLRLSDGQGVPEGGASLPVPDPQSEDDDLPAADHIDGHPHAEQSPLRRRLCLWPSTLQACRRWKEAAPKARTRRLALLHPRRPSRLHHLGAVPAEPQDSRRPMATGSTPLAPRRRGRVRRCCRGARCAGAAAGICGLATSLGAAGWRHGMSVARRRPRSGEPTCQSIAGRPIDIAIGELIAAEMTPAAMELALEIRKEIEARHDEADRLRLRAVERAQFEAELAQRRFMLVDPSNRLVADTLEREWNDKLRALAPAQEERERERQKDRVAVDDAIRQRLVAMTTDFKTLWHDPSLPNRERKRLLAYIIEDVTLVKLPTEGRRGSISASRAEGPRP